MKKHLVTFILLLLFISANADPPDPPVGKRWILNELFSDEFNDSALDHSKWYDYHPTWDGREPGLFLPSQVSVANGYMSIRGEKMEKDTIITSWNGTQRTYNIAAGAVVSKSESASFGYYECRFKAASTSMSTTFWLSTKQNYNGPESCNDKYGLELDIQECIGREGDFQGSWFAKGMHSNGHFWYTDCDGEKHDYRAPEVRFESEELASDNFNIYGAWWRNASSATYYYNNSESKSHDFYSGVKSEPFDQPMSVNLVSETYPFPWIELPTDEELADTSKNICYYDWIRAYTLVGVDADGGQDETSVFDEEISFTEKPGILTNAADFDFLMTYRANADREIWMEITNQSESIIASGIYPAKGGFGKKILNLAVGSELEEGTAYTARIFIRPLGSEVNDHAYMSDEFTFTVENPADISIIVKDERLDSVIPGAEVQINGERILTNNEGLAAFLNFPVGKLNISAAAEGYQSYSTAYTISGDTSIYINLLPRNYRILIIVKDVVYPHAIPGAKVTIGESSYTTDASGRASFILPYGPNVVLVDASKYYQLKDTIFAEDIYSIDVFIEKEYAEVSFYVRMDNSVLANAAVNLGNAIQTTSSKGLAVFDEVRVNTRLKYDISLDEEKLKEDSASFYNDSTININLFSDATAVITGNEFSVYPNPVKDQLNIQGLSGETNFKILNLKGLVLKQGIISLSKKIDTSELQLGMYILQLSGDKGFRHLAFYKQ